VLRLFLLLLGSPAARRLRWTLAFVGLACLALAASVATDVARGLRHFPFHLFGYGLIALALVTLGGAAINQGIRRKIRVIRALLLASVGYALTDNVNIYDVVLAVVVGGAYAVDGIFRAVASALVRFRSWPLSLAVGALELLIAALIWEPYPSHHTWTVPVCLAVLLGLLGLTCVRMAYLLQRTPKGTSLPLLFSRGELPDIEAATRFSCPVESTERGSLTVHVWTPKGVLEHPERRPLIDRYVAAVDERGVISTGHAALEAAPDIYISHYPGVELDRDPADFVHALRSTADNDVKARYLPDYASEAAGWCDSTAQVHFEGMDIGRLRAFWAHYRAVDIYNLTRRNCAITAVLALETALEGWLTRGHISPRKIFRLLASPELWIASQLRKRAESMTWTPGLVLDYARALSGVLQVTTESWRTKVARAFTWQRAARAEVREEASLQETSLAEARLRALAHQEPTQGASRALSISAVTATASIFGLTYGLSAPLIAQNLQSAGRGTFFIGLNAAMHAVGVLAVAPFLPKLTQRFGARKLIIAALLATACILPVFIAVPSIWLWFPLRLGLGMAAEVLLVLSESWANQMSSAASRGRTMAVYMAALSLGMAGGPGIISVVGPTALAFLVGAGLAAGAILPLLHPRVSAPDSGAHGHAGVGHYLRLAPLALGAALLNAAVESAGLSFVPIYAMRLGWTEPMAMRLISTLLIGAIVMQLPIGFLADKLKAKKLMLALGVLSVAGALAWPVLFEDQKIAFVTVFLWGGVFVGLYTVMLTALGSKFQGTELVGIYSVMSVFWGAGALVGPAVVGAAMTWSPLYGLPFAVAAGCALFVLGVLREP
jgi:MFS family permease/uncharacterized membrane protein HdeD (DUF308 family)